MYDDQRSQSSADARAWLEGPGRKTMRRWRPFASVVVGSAFLLWPAAYNGYPLLFVDSGEYLMSSQDFVVRLHPIVYPLFLRVTHLNSTLWGPAVVHALLTATVVRVLVGTCEPRISELGFVTLIGLLAALTSVGWFVSHVTPDIFAGLSILSLFLLLFFSEGLRKRTRVALGALLSLSIAVHATHLLLVIALTMAIGLLAACASIRRRWRHTPSSPSSLLGRVRTGIPRVLGWVGVAVVVMPVAHGLLAGQLFIASHGSVWLLGRLVQDGIIQRLLDDHCEEQAYALCAYRHDLPSTADEFVWSATSPLERIGGWGAADSQATAMIVDSVLAYPGMHLRALAANTVAQALTVRVEVDVQREDLASTRTIQRRFRRDQPAFASSRQQQGTLVPTWIASVHAWVAAASAVASVGIVTLGLVRGWSVTLGLHLFTWTALLLNAAITANLSDIVPRYQARVVWLMPLVVGMTLASAVRDRSRGSTLSRGDTPAARSETPDATLASGY